jgi:hypothetical protein
MDILNFISWLKSGRYSSTVPANAVTVVGVPTNRRDDKYLPVTVPVSALAGSSGFTHYIGELFGGGIIVQVWKDSLGIEHGLIASLTNLSAGIVWTVPGFIGTLIGPTAQSFSNGLTNTNAIIAQTTAPVATTYAAGLARLYLGGGFNDWYLPANWELNACYNSANIVNKVLGTTNGFAFNYYWSSTEANSNLAWVQDFYYGYQFQGSKSFNIYSVRAVRTF